MLGKTETIDLYREVTPTERAAMEEADAAFSRPPQGFIDFVQSIGIQKGNQAIYNEATGFFELNELKDITYAQMRVIVAQTSTYRVQGDYQLNYATCRTNFMSAGSINSTASVIGMFMQCQSLETAYLYPQWTGRCRIANAMSCFAGCKKLRKVLTVLDMSQISGASNVLNMFNNCSALEDVQLWSLKVSISFANSPLLSLNSLTFAITNALNALTITVHKDVYAKILNEDGTTPDWAALTDLAATKGIVIASA